MRVAFTAAGLAVLAGSLGVAALHAGSAPSFAAARSYATGSHPGSVAIGDLNGDGKRDLVTLNVYTNTASVLLHKGAGGFRAKRDYATGRNPSSVAIGDLNGDGRPDLVTANWEANTVSMLLNKGDGSFQAKRDYGTGCCPHSVAIGDLNRDGELDLAIANLGLHADTVDVLLNRGDGSFKAKVGYPTGHRPYSVAIGDLNGDGKPELATANLVAHTVSVLVNRGDGSFRAKRDYATGREPVSIAIGDLNSDGKPDLATANANRGGAGTVSVLANRGNGSFQAKRDYATGRGPQSVAIGDLNGDGKPDLATANYYASTVSVLVNMPGLCTVQDVNGQILPTAKRRLARANCRVGTIRRAYSSVKTGRVISQTPKPGTVLPKRGKVNLVVSRGRRAS
jgi:hypothetical protein